MSTIGKQIIKMIRELFKNPNMVMLNICRRNSNVIQLETFIVINEPYNYSFASVDIRQRRTGETETQVLYRVETYMRSSRRSDWELGIRLFSTLNFVAGPLYMRVKNMVVRR